VLNTHIYVWKTNHYAGSLLSSSTTAPWLLTLESWPWARRRRMIDTRGSIRYFNRSGEDYLLVLQYMGVCWTTNNFDGLGRWELLWSILRQSFLHSRRP
jgi:hypothetical protein